MTLPRTSVALPSQAMLALTQANQRRSAAAEPARTCTGCGEVKPWLSFPVRSKWPDGTVRTVHSACRECKSAREYMRRRRAGTATSPTRGSAGERLPIGPLRQFLTGELCFRNVETMAAASGVDVRVIHRLLNEAVVVGLVQADRLITRLGGVLELVYPYDGGSPA